MNACTKCVQLYWLDASSVLLWNKQLKKHYLSTFFSVFPIYAKEDITSFIRIQFQSTNVDLSYRTHNNSIKYEDFFHLAQDPYPMCEQIISFRTNFADLYYIVYLKYNFECMTFTREYSIAFSTNSWKPIRMVTENFRLLVSHKIFNVFKMDPVWVKNIWNTFHDTPYNRLRYCSLDKVVDSPNVHGLE